MEEYFLTNSIKRDCEALSKASGQPIAIIMKNDKLLYIISCEEHELYNPGSHLYQNKFTGVDIMLKILNNEFTKEGSPSGESNVNTYRDSQIKFEFEFSQSFDVLLINESLD